MDYRLTDDDKERIKLLEEVSKNKFKNFTRRFPKINSKILPLSS